MSFLAKAFMCKRCCRQPPVRKSGSALGIDINTLPEVMDVGELVDAALVGFDRRELVTIPPLHDAARWDGLQSARQGLLSELRQARAAQRYRPQ